MLLSVLAAAALSQTVADTSLTDATPVEEERICKREKPVGTLVRAKKVCRSKADWKMIEDASIEYAREMQRATRRRI
jgi:hypothetical protein